MIEKQEELQQSAKRSSDSSVRITDAASVRSAGSAVERLSEVMSFKTAAGSVLSRRERRQQREQLCREGKGHDYVILSPEGHAKRQQSAAMLKIGPEALMHLSGDDVDRLHCLLLTQNVGELSGGLICLTRLMGSVEMLPETRGGIEGTVLRVTIATQSEAFIPTRDPEELAGKKAEIAGELIDQAIKAVSDLGKKDSAEQKMLRAMLKGELQGANLSKAPGIKDLVLTGFVGNVDERAARASMALGQLLKAPDSGFSPLEDIPGPLEDDQVGQGEKMKEYAEGALAT
jgi:hypothetical protein